MDSQSSSTGKGQVEVVINTAKVTKFVPYVPPATPVAGPSNIPTSHNSLSFPQSRRHSSSMRTERSGEGKELEVTLNERLSAGATDIIDEQRLFQRTINQLKPIDALNCAWLRLTKEQVSILEQRCRDEGIEPGIHAHSDVLNYDVFEELREIRRKEKEVKIGNPNDITDKIRLYKRT